MVAFKDILSIDYRLNVLQPHSPTPERAFDFAELAGWRRQSGARERTASSPIVVARIWALPAPAAPLGLLPPMRIAPVPAFGQVFAIVFPPFSSF